MKITNKQAVPYPLLRDCRVGAVVRFPDGVHQLNDPMMKITAPISFKHGEERIPPYRHQYKPKYCFIVSLISGKTYRLPSHFKTQELDIWVECRGDLQP